MTAASVARVRARAVANARRAVTALAIAVLAAGCVEGGVRLKRVDASRSDTDLDIMVLPPFECDFSVLPLNCATPFRLPASEGHVVTFSNREWSSASGKWCNENGMHGAIFSFRGTNANDSNSISVNSMDGSLRLMLTVSPGSYGGGGLAFEAGCTDMSAFTGVQFTVAVASGSLTGCSYQLQLQTFEQRPTTQAPSGGCDQATMSCYGYPAAANLPAPSTDLTMPTLVTVPFTSFGPSVMPAPAQIVGLQWQVNASTGSCTVELRIDDVAFIPGAAPPEPTTDGGGDDGSGGDGGVDDASTAP
jgi:hypothetical protein